MSYDMSILGTNARPERTVSLAFDAHEQIVEVANQLGLCLLPRIANYYEDAVFFPAEILALKSELGQVCAYMDAHGQSIPPCLIGLIDLAVEAETHWREIVGIAD